MTNLLVYRFEQYFRHPDQHHNVLSVDDRAIACRNIRRAIEMLGVESAPSLPSDDRLYDKGLKMMVERFQMKFQHRVVDGRVGSGTRHLLVHTLLERFDITIFQRFDRTETCTKPSIFLSYAWKDRSRVNTLDQWLRDHGVWVLRDENSFVAGTGLTENVRRAVARADKVIAVLSANSRDRDWPRLERTVAEELESQIGEPVLIYVQLDGSSLPSHDPNRLAIPAANVPLKDVGLKILHALEVAGVSPRHYDYDENEPM